jgi:sodium transport system permease protein
MDLAVTIGLAFCLHPSYVAIATAVSNEYKLGEQTTAMLTQFDSIIGSTSIWYVLLVLALLPAVCEELVFRGFLFAGLLRNGGHVRAILVTAILFGLSHGVLQQSITASIMGLVLGWLAYKTGGVACTIAFHVAHNSISMLLAASSHNKQPIPQFLSWALEINDGRLCYSVAWSTLSVGVAISLVAWMATRNIKDRRTNAQKSWERVANEAKQVIAR